MTNQRSLTQARKPLGLVLAAVVLFGSVWWITDAATPRVTLVAATRGDAAEVVYATGVVEPKVWAKVVSLERKRIVDLCRCEGEAVTQGDVLGRLDDVEERAILAELEARRATLADEVGRYEQLLARNVVSRASYDEKRTQLAEIEARIAAQKDRISHLELRAPMTGTVLRKDGEVGEIAGTGPNDAIFWVGQPRPLQVVAEVNEEDIPQVRIGQRVLLRHDGWKGDPLEAVVAEITPKGDPDTKTFRVKLALPDGTPLMIGMSVEANIVVHEAKDVLLAPSEAVSNGAVLGVREGRIVRIPVETGIRGSRMVEIKGGLSGGEEIVSPYSAALGQGERVKATRSAPP